MSAAASAVHRRKRITQRSRPIADRRILAVSATRWSSTLTDLVVSLAGVGRWYGPVFPRLKGATRPFGIGLRPALDPRGPPVLAGRNCGQGRGPARLTRPPPAVCWLAQQEVAD